MKLIIRFLSVAVLLVVVLGVFSSMNRKIVWGCAVFGDPCGSCDPACTSICIAGECCYISCPDPGGGVDPGDVGDWCPDPGTCGGGQCWDDWECACVSYGCGGGGSPVCGNFSCEAGEDCSNCPSDCGTCPVPPTNTPVPPPTNTPTPPATPPDAPSLSSLPNGFSSFSVTGINAVWNAISNWGYNPAGNNNTYTVYLDTGTNPSTVLCNVPEGTTSCQTGTLADSTLYYWKVAASNGALSSYSAIWNFYTPSAIFGWLYTEKDNAITRSTEASEGLIPSYILNLTGGRTYVSTGSQITGYTGNYLFGDVQNGLYTVSLQVTPTGSALYPLYTSTQYALVAGSNVSIDFPFITITPSPTIIPPSGIPTNTPVPSPNPSPTPLATPTSVSAPPDCSVLPAPAIQGPANQLCTNAKPNFEAFVSNPNGESVWARFYTNNNETFSRMGSVLPDTGGTSLWTPDGSVLNTTGNYWWSAFSESPSCPRSADALSRLLKMDYSPPDAPAKPNCSLVLKDPVTGNCNFVCSWSQNPENDGSCSDTNDYHPVFWNSPGPGAWDAGWIGNVTTQNINDVPAGQNLNVQLISRDSLGNTSSVSPVSGPFSCSALVPTNTPMPTPTSILPSPPDTCKILPTPVLNAPGHETCTNIKPNFRAAVSNPNSDTVWAHFYTDYHEKFSQTGSVVNPAGGESLWVPDSTNLNVNGSYWWTAYAQSPTCPRSADAPAALLRMDYSPPPQPKAPTCILESQDTTYTGTCTFLCSWDANLESDNSCANTNEYWPSYTNSPGPGGWAAHKVMTPQLSERVENVPDGQAIMTRMYAKDGAGNISEVSTIGGPYTCPRINTGPTITPGGPTPMPASPTPTVYLTPTITPTPSPGAWLQVVGGDIYQKKISQDALPFGQSLIAPIIAPQNPSSAGVALWQESINAGDGLSISSNNWNVRIDSGLSNQYSFQFYWEALKNKALTIPNKSIIGDPADLTDVDTIYSYGSTGYTQLSQSFVPKTPVTIFLISGSLEITKNFSVTSGQSVIFIVSGHIMVDSAVTNIPGLYISSGTFTVDSGNQKFVLDGMVYAKSLSLNRSYKSYSVPTYQFIYQPKYTIALLPYIARSQVNWQELKP